MNQPLSVISAGDKFDPLFDLDEAEICLEFPQRLLPRYSDAAVDGNSFTAADVGSCVRVLIFARITFRITCANIIRVGSVWHEFNLSTLEVPSWWRDSKYSALGASVPQ